MSFKNTLLGLRENSKEYVQAGYFPREVKIPLWCVHPSEEAVKFEKELLAEQPTRAPLV